MMDDAAMNQDLIALDCIKMRLLRRDVCRILPRGKASSSQLRSSSLDASLLPQVADITHLVQDYELLFGVVDLS